MLAHFSSWDSFSPVFSAVALRPFASQHSFSRSSVVLMSAGASLAAKAGQTYRAIASQTQDGVTIALLAGSFDHGSKGAVENPADFVQIILVAVPLKHSQHLA